MKKIIIFFALVFSVGIYAQTPDRFRNGVRSPFYQPDTLSTIQRDDLSANFKLGTIIYHKDEGISQWEQWDGTSFAPFGQGSTTIPFDSITGLPTDNTALVAELNKYVKVNPNSLVTPLTLAISDSTTIASGIFMINDVVIDTTTRTPGGDEFVDGGSLSESGVLTLNRNYGSPIQIPGFNSGSNYLLKSGGTMSGAINMGGFSISNILNISPEALTYSNSGFRKWQTTNAGSLIFSSENSLGSGTYTVRFTFNLNGSASLPTDVLNKGYGDANYKTSVSGTSTTLQLNSAVGYYGNMTTPNSSTSYTIGASPVLGGWAKIRINAATQPSITGATLISGDAFEASTDMYMIATYNGVITEYYFKKIGL